MPVDVNMPSLGESVIEATVVKWLIREGDVGQKDQPLLEVATDKVDTEIPAPTSGRVIKILLKEHAVVPVHGILCQVEEGYISSPLLSPPPPIPKIPKKRRGVNIAQKP